MRLHLDISLRVVRQRARTHLLLCDALPNIVHLLISEMKQEIIDNGDPVEEYILHKDKYPEPKLAYRVDNRYSFINVLYIYIYIYI